VTAPGAVAAEPSPNLGEGFPTAWPTWDAYDRYANPRVPTRAVFELLARTGRRTGETDDQYLTYLATRRYRLGAYAGSTQTSPAAASAQSHWPAPTGKAQQSLSADHALLRQSTDE
jgi:type II secretory pathway component HofQ